MGVSLSTGGPFVMNKTDGSNGHSFTRVRGGGIDFSLLLLLYNILITVRGRKTGVETPRECVVVGFPTERASGYNLPRV